MPAGGTIEITYTLGTTTATDTVALTANNSFWTADWDSSVADYGPGSWQVFSTGSTTAASSGELRILDTTA